MGRRRGEVSREALKARDNIVEAYCAFWDHARFKHGWMKPVFSKEEVMHLLQRAALIVARGREELDRKDPHFKIRSLDGAAQEFLWTVSESPFKNDPRGDEFVRKLVHATFQDGEGYVEGLDEEMVNDFIARYGHMKTWRSDSAAETKVSDGARASEELLEELRHKWSATARKVNGLIQSIDSEDPLFAADATRQQKFTAHALQTASACDRWQERLRTILHTLATLEGEVTAMQDERQRVIQRAKADAAEATNMTPMRVEDEEEADVDGDVEEGGEEEEGAMQAIEPLAEGEAEPEAEADVADVEEVDDEMDTATARADEEAEAVAELDRISREIETNEEKLERRTRLLREWLAKEDKGDIMNERTELSGFEKQVGELTHSFMTLLHNLDGLIGPAHLRPARKQKVKVVNACLDRLERVMGELKIARSDLEKRAAAEKQRETKIRIEREEAEKRRRRERRERERSEAEAAKHAAPSPPPAATKETVGGGSAAPSTSAPASGSNESSASEGSEDEAANIWRQLRMKPRMDVRERRDHYEIVAHIPGMRLSDVKLSCKNNVLTIGGFREPSQQDLLALQRQARDHIMRQRQQRMWGLGGMWGEEEEEDERDLLLRLAAGRFGSFSEQFRLPPGQVDEHGIAAHYDKGTLSVVVPKAKKTPTPAPASTPSASSAAAPRTRSHRRPQRPRYPASATPFGAFGEPSDFGRRGFFDRDMFL
eukprot:TRINITY_DN2400_c0_g1_i1.p1 TRINITY_DN2400_c0_g1~~TRINITY_DN2400_c0_g1_i1.p1  ORF type:complete len:715 (-),score=221.30 TRINITY_DN2400_c0_g1_i1:1977-4121(-)